MLRVGLYESPKCPCQTCDGICAHVGLANLWNNIAPTGINAARALHQEHRLKQTLL